MAANVNPGPFGHIIAIPFQLLNLPWSSWGISYDIDTNATRLEPPDGWYAWTSSTYRPLIRRLTLMGFIRHQYSDYRGDNIFGATAWFSAISLMLIDPPMKLETTVQSLKVHYYSNLHLLDVTDMVQTGGFLSPRLRAPVPANLLPGPGRNVVGINGGAPAPPVNLRLPKYTRLSVASTNTNNWRT